MPGGKKRWWILAVAGFAAVAVIAAILIPGGDRLPPSQTLPDGTVVSIAQVSYGKVHRFLPGNAWQRFAARVLPDKLAQRLKVPATPFVVTNAADTTVIFLQSDRSGITNSGPGSPQPYIPVGYHSALHLTDDAGNDYIFESQAAFTPTNGLLIEAFKLPLVSHAATKFNLKITHSYSIPGPDTAGFTSHFSIPNPAPRSKPQWKAEPLPLTNKVDDLTFELLELSTHPPRIPPAATYRNRPPPDLENFTTVRYQVLENGSPALAQRIKAVTASDEDGNSYEIPPLFLGSGTPGRIELHGGFSPQQAFRFRFELGRIPPFDADESVALTNITVPDVRALGNASNVSLSLELHGYTMHIDQLWETNQFRVVYVRYQITPPLVGFRHYFIVKSLSSRLAMG